MKIVEEQLQQSSDAIVDLKFSAEHLQSAVLMETRYLRSSATAFSYHSLTLSGVSLSLAALTVLVLIALKMCVFNDVFRPIIM